VGKTINHPFGNVLYMFIPFIPPIKIVMTGGWFMIVLSCFTHIRRTLLAMDQDSCVFSFPREDVFVFAGI
jgi:hypothetical protein